MLNTRNSIAKIMKEVKVVKDEEKELPVPTVWRSVFHEIVKSFVEEDYTLSSGISGVGSIPYETSNQIKEYIQDYGETLINLPEQSWDSSICIWLGSKWDVLVDLWTEAEGRSDMVLNAEVFEVEDGYRISINMVYVP